MKRSIINEKLFCLRFPRLFFLLFIFFLLIVPVSCSSNQQDKQTPPVPAESPRNRDADGKADTQKFDDNKASPSPYPKTVETASPVVSPPVENGRTVFKSREEEIRYYIETGDEKLKTNKLKEAVKYLTKAVEMDPENYSAYDKRSMAYYNLGEHEKGIEDCSKAIKIAKKEGNFEERCPRGTLARRGAHYFNLKRYDEAIRDFHTVIRYAPGFSFAYYDLGQCYFQKGELDKAEEYFKKAIKLNEDKRITRSARKYLEKIKMIKEQ